MERGYKEYDKKRRSKKFMGREHVEEDAEQQAAFKLMQGLRPLWPAGRIHPDGPTGFNRVFHNEHFND
jgi:hypothetical protein